MLSRVIIAAFLAIAPLPVAAQFRCASHSQYSAALDAVFANEPAPGTYKFLFKLRQLPSFGVESEILFVQKRDGAFAVTYSKPTKQVWSVVCGHMELSEATKAISVEVRQVALSRDRAELVLEKFGSLRVAPVNDYLDKIGFLDGVSYDLLVDSYPNTLSLHIYDTTHRVANPNQELLDWIHAFRRDVIETALIEPSDGTTKLVGVVSDSNGSIIEGVRVALDCKAGEKQETASDSDGYFRFPHLTINSKVARHGSHGDSMFCSLNAGKEGFKTLRFPGIEIEAGKEQALHLTLEPGSPSEVVMPGEVFGPQR